MEFDLTKLQSEFLLRANDDRINTLKQLESQKKQIQHHFKEVVKILLEDLDQSTDEETLNRARWETKDGKTKLILPNDEEESSEE